MPMLFRAYRNACQRRADHAWSGLLQLEPRLLLSSVAEISAEYIGQAVFADDYTYQGTLVGGLSAISYDTANDRYFVLSDDKSNINDARFYTVSIDLSDGTLADGDVNFQQLTTLTRSGAAYPAGSIDPEGIAWDPTTSSLYISSEGDAGADIDPAIDRFDLTGARQESMSLPFYYLPIGTSQGVRDNLGFESLTRTPNGAAIYTATEQSLYQDGEISTFTTQSPCRILGIETGAGQTLAEYVYYADTLTDAPPAVGANGLVELIALDNNGSFLAMERQLTDTTGLNIRLYLAHSQQAQNINGIDNLSGFNADNAVSKQLVYNFGAHAVSNFEGMTLGPTLPDGRQSLIAVADNQLGAAAGALPTTFMAFALDITWNNAPQFMSTPQTSATEDQPYSHTVQVTDADTDDAITITAPTLPTWLNLTDNGDGTATITGTPSLANVGTAPIAIQATDRIGDSAGQTFNITVGYNNTAPTIDTKAYRSGKTNSSIILTATVTDPDKDPLAITWDFGNGIRTRQTTLNDNSYQNTGSAQISAAKFYAAADVYQVTLTVDDGKQSAQQQIKVLINPPAGSFTDPQSTDVLQLDTSTGTLYVDSTDAGQNTQRTKIGGSVPDDWHLIGMTDVNIDANPDVIWWNSKTGHLSAWLLNGSQVVGTQYLNQVADINWQPGAISDFDGNGDPDLLWQHQRNGEVSLWQINAENADFQVSQTVPLGFLGGPSNWQLIGAGTINSDPRPDLLWRNSQTGQAVAWIMSPTVPGKVIDEQIINLTSQSTGYRMTANDGTYLGNLYPTAGTGTAGWQLRPNAGLIDRLAFGTCLSCLEQQDDT